MTSSSNGALVQFIHDRTYNTILSYAKQLKMFIHFCGALHEDCLPLFAYSQMKTSKIWI